MVRQEKLARMVRTARLDHRVYKVYLVLWDLLETRGQWENREGKEILESQEPKDPEVILVRMVCLDQQGQLDLLDHLESEARLGLLDQEAFKACLDHRVRMEWLAGMARLVFRVLLE